MDWSPVNKPIDKLTPKRNKLRTCVFVVFAADMVLGKKIDWVVRHATCHVAVVQPKWTGTMNEI